LFTQKNSQSVEREFAFLPELDGNVSSVQKAADMASFPVLTAHAQALDTPYIVCCEQPAKGELSFARRAPVECTSEAVFCGSSPIS